MLTLEPGLLSDMACATVVTPSAERASALRLAYDFAQMARRSVWRTPDAISMGAWLEREANRAAEAGEPIPRPLRAAQEWYLWREAAEIESGARGTSRLGEALARSARLLTDWQIPRTVLERSGSEACELLARSLKRVESRCREAHAAPSHMLITILTKCAPRRGTVFSGFLEASAARRVWMRSALERSTTAREHRCSHAPGRVLAERASDPEEELEQAAAWCRSHLEADSSRRLLVIVPGLAEQRAETVRVLAQVLAPRRTLEGARSDDVIAVEGGEPLTSTPLIRHTLISLVLLSEGLDYAVMSAWLRSAFWPIPETDRAILDAWLRDVLPHDVTARELVAALDSAPARLGDGVRAVSASVRSALEALGDTTTAAPLGRWAQRFTQALEVLGVLADRLTSSLALQAKSRLAEGLTDLAALGGHSGDVTAPQAVRLLETMLERTSISPLSCDAAVVVTGALTDPIVHYDGIWIAGLHAGSWPEPPAVNPFIPLAAQVEARLPGLSVPNRLAKARELLDRWRRCADELVVSWPERIEDVRCLPSPLIVEQRDVTVLRPLQRRPNLARRIRESGRVEAFVDTRGTDWPASVPIPAGTRALELQSRCPFRAYAELRLRAGRLEVPRLGVDPRDRGKLLHRALELLWRDLGDSATLDARETSASLDALIKRCVERAAEEAWSALGAARTSRVSAFSREAAERRRAERLLQKLCALERERPAFHVRALERALTLELAGAKLNVRIDRIDELDDGTFAILDYKTGKPAALDWLADRLVDLQLPVYLLACEAEVSTLAQVQLLASGIAFRGLADRGGRLVKLPGLSGEGGETRRAWRAQVERWRALIEQLARAFLAGEASVNPAPAACRGCHLHTFCRVREIEREGASADATGEPFSP